MLGAKFINCDVANVNFKDTVRDENTVFDERCKTEGMHFDDYVKVYGVRVYTGTNPQLIASNRAEIQAHPKRKRGRAG